MLDVRFVRGGRKPWVVEAIDKIADGTRVELPTITLPAFVVVLCCRKISP
jgi:hypothetical protein